MPNQIQKNIQKSKRENELVNSIREKRGPGLYFVAQANPIQSFTHGMRPLENSINNQSFFSYTFFLLWRICAYYTFLSRTSIYKIYTTVKHRLLSTENFLSI